MADFKIRENHVYVGNTDRVFGDGRGTGHWHLKLNPSEVSVSLNTFV